MTTNNINVLEPDKLEIYMQGYRDGRQTLTLDLYDFIYTSHTAKELKAYCIKLYNEERGTKCN